MSSHIMMEFERAPVNTKDKFSDFDLSLEEKGEKRKPTINYDQKKNGKIFIQQSILSYLKLKYGNLTISQPLKDDDSVSEIQVGIVGQPFYLA